MVMRLSWSYIILGMRSSITESHNYLLSIIGNAPYGIATINLAGVITICNKMFLSHLGIGKLPKEAIDSSLLDMIHKIDSLATPLRTCIKKGRKKFDIQVIEIDERFITIKVRKILDGMIITTSDITSAKQHERNVLNAIIQGQEEERKRLAKDIHDGIGPLLSTIKLNVDGVIGDVQRDLPKKTQKKLDNIHELIETVSTDIRSISHALMPSALEDFGLITTLQNLVLKINDANASTKITFFHTGFDDRLAQRLELSLYRITQELINNALKYAQAKNITIQLIKSQAEVVLTVEDDGVGFDLNKVKENTKLGSGLKNLQSRVKALYGTMEIDTQIGYGCTTTVKF